MVGARHPSCTIDNCLAEGETRHAQLVIHGVWFASSESGGLEVPCGPTVSARQLVPGGCDLYFVELRGYTSPSKMCWWFVNSLG